ncbi:TPA: hypothetical protein ACJ2TK_004154 [Klebsiella pneumoniae]
MTKSTITRERIQRIIRAIDSEAYDEEEIREWLSSDEIIELSRMALAAMDSKPVAWTDEQELRDVDRGGCGYLFTVNPVTPHADERRIILLYRHAPPAPVVTDEATAEDCPAFVKYDVTGVDEAWACGFNACRAAMKEVK